MEGNELNIIVIANDIYPQPHIEWFKDDQPIKELDTFHFEYQESTFKLSVPNSNTSVQGSYKFSLSNELGTVEGACNIKIFGNLKLRIVN